MTRINFAFVRGPGDDDGSINARTPLSSHGRALEEFARQRAIPLGEEDLDRGDNSWAVTGNDTMSRLRMIARPLHGTSQADYQDADRLLAELAGRGYRPAPTSRLGAAAATGGDQELLGWRAFLDVAFWHPRGGPY